MNAEQKNIFPKKGFTLLELLVSIAIAALITSIVVSSLSIMRNKSNDSAVQTALYGMRTQADIFYNVGKTYTGICAMTGNNVLGPSVLAAAQTVGVSFFSNNTLAGTISNAVCNDSDTAWAVQIKTKAATGVICADSTGIVVRSTTSLITTAIDYVCQ